MLERGLPQMKVTYDERRQWGASVFKAAKALGGSYS